MKLERIGTVPFYFYWLGRIYLWFGGWRVQGPRPEFDKYVAIFAPHTCLGDMPRAMAMTFVLRVKGNSMIKNSVFVGPLGWLLRRLGAIPIKRDKHLGVVDQVVQEFERRDHIIMAIAPEGTRGYTDHWKSGFYQIAVKAKVPIVCAFWDYERRVTGQAGAIHPTGDMEADMAKIRAIYEKITPKYPSRRSAMRFKTASKDNENAA